MSITEFPFEYLHSEIVQFLLTYADEASVLKKLEDMGVRVGLALAEFLSMDMLPLRAEIDVVKFLCKEFWCAIFGKQVNSLRTNHQGIYVIYDNSFVLLQPFSNNNQYQEEVQRYLAFTRGLIRGVLGDFGLNAAVVADVQEMPAVRFSINLKSETFAFHRFLIVDVCKWTTTAQAVQNRR
ncbi:Trafficking protein particle complex subunit 6b [Trichinella spiralis]|uniref:Trafficking protein particle complex subunit 6b n=1 Tax=Trichinella spiralis TaxID=6334 RepID=A0ABR3K701_TRISP